MSYVVVYESQTGSTRKVAEAIAAALAGDFAAIPIVDKPALEGADLVFVGFPIHNFGPPRDVEVFLKEAYQGAPRSPVRDPCLAGGRRAAGRLAE